MADPSTNGSVRRWQHLILVLLVLLAILAMPINPAITLFHDVRVIGNFDMDQTITIILQIDTFGCRICSKQDTSR